MKISIRSFTQVSAIGLAVAAMLSNLPATAAPAENAQEREAKLIEVLKSGTPQEKAITCKKLAVYGGKEAVPALAALLLDTHLSSWARIALEAIPDPSAGDALREAMSKAAGNPLIGIINSLGIRRDAKSVGPLTQKLSDYDVEVVTAAAIALGKIGGDEASSGLTRALAAAPAARRSGVAQGCVLCAEGYLADGKAGEAVRIYDLIRQSSLPKQRILEATRGAIVARGTAGLPLLIEQLKSTDPAFYGIGLRTARELPGKDVTAALTAEFARSNPDLQSYLLLALADRGDATALPTIREAAKSGPKKVRLAAIGALERLDNNGSSAPVLIDIAVGDDADLAKTAKSTLGRLPGKQVDAGVMAVLPQSSGKTRQTLIDMAGQRRIAEAMPVLMASVQDSDAGIRGAAVNAVGLLGDEKQAADLVGLLPKTENANDRASIESALMAIAGRSGEKCLPFLLPLAQNADASLRKVAIHSLSSVGGSTALGVVKSSLDDKDPSVQDEAVRTLSGWPSNWPDDSGVAEPLLTLATSGKKTSHQVLGVRGYLEYLQRDKKLSDDDKVAKVKSLLPLIKRPEEKRLAIAALGSVPTAAALELLVTYTTDDAVIEEACSAIVVSAGRDDLKGASKELRQKSLQAVVAKSEVDRTKKRAQEVLKRIR